MNTDAKPVEKLRTFLNVLFCLIFLGVLSMHMLQAVSVLKSPDKLSKKPDSKKTTEEILKDIHKEVSELGRRKDEHFIKREFHFDLDENPTNSEEHIVVLIYGTKETEKMIVQVTYFEAEGSEYIVKYAKDIKLVNCTLTTEKLEIVKCDFSKKEMKPLMADILKGIQEEKKLYRFIDKHRIRLNN